MSRPAFAHIRLDAFRHNYQVAKRVHGGKALAVVKANAYGHGAVPCALAIENEADGYAVACIEEALALRKAGIRQPILLLEGFFEASELPEIVRHQLWIVIHHRWQVDLLLSCKLDKPVHVWLKMDSGMHRVGLVPEQYAEIAEQLNAHMNVASIVAMTHFANADQLDCDQTVHQLFVFNHIFERIQPLSKVKGSSLANSAAILGWPISYASWSRPGIMLYGLDPLKHSQSKQMHPERHLRAVMQLKSRIISTKKIGKGESIGYGSIFKAQRDTVIGVVACGYADGYPRLASSPSPYHTAHLSHTPVAVEGQLTQLIGRVSMDMLYVDLTDLPQHNIGSEVELWGEQISVHDIASAAGTIAYELFCNVKRVAFQYSDT